MRALPWVPAALLAAVLGAGSAHGAAAPPRHPALEDAYTITSVLQLVPPADPAVMDDDLQDARVIARDESTVTVEVTYYPFQRQNVGENPNWRAEDPAMAEYLRPTPSENWDEAMRRDLLAELGASGIDPARLTDRALVQQVASWALRRSRSVSPFAVWCVSFPEGKPAVFPPLRGAFDHEKPAPDWTDQRMFDEEVLGGAMFRGRTHGDCTSSSIYLATILRALGIPTRIVVCIPPFDPNDSAQAELFYAGVTNHQVRETVRAALSGAHGFCDHLFNEVYVGHRWVRLNYATLGQPILDRHYFGLLTHIDTTTSVSQLTLPETWGLRYFQYPSGQARLGSSNPYRLLSVRDHFGANAHLENPPVPIAELRTLTVVRLIRPGSPELPDWVQPSPRSPPDFFLSCREWLPGVSYVQLRAFLAHASDHFLLTSPGRESVRVILTGSVSRGDGSFQAYAARVDADDRGKIVPGVAYVLQAENSNDTYRWVLDPNLGPIRF